MDCQQRRGLSLLEVMLSLAILGGALAVIGELTRMAVRNAGLARDSTNAQLLAESIMSELALGLLPLEPVQQTVVTDPLYANEWTYSINVQAVDQQGLVAVSVLVVQDQAVASRPVRFQLSRWLIDQSQLATATGGNTSNDASTTGSSTATTSGATSTSASSATGS